MYIMIGKTNYYNEFLLYGSRCRGDRELSRICNTNIIMSKAIYIEHAMVGWEFRPRASCY